MDTTLTKSQVTRLAKGIPLKSLQTFYANPANQKAFQEWKKKRDQNGSGND